MEFHGSQLSSSNAHVTDDVQCIDCGQVWTVDFTIERDTGAKYPVNNDDLICDECRGYGEVIV